MVARSQVLVYEMLLDKDYGSYIVLNVHDSIILAVKIEEYLHVVQEVIEIMCSQVPPELTHKTLPPVHFVTEVGPENAQKWGWRHGQEYPLSLDHFVNRWGSHWLTEGERAKPPEKREAPTWVGPVYMGWTLEKEIEEIRAARARLLVTTDSVETEPVGQEWFELENILKQFDALALQMAQTGMALKPHRQPANIRYIVPDGGSGVPDTKIVGPFQFPERMIASATLQHRGHSIESYRTTLQLIKPLLTLSSELVELSDALREWEEKYRDLLPDAE